VLGAGLPPGRPPTRDVFERWNNLPEQYRICDWDSHFENASSRKLKRLDWIAIPNRMDGTGYTALVDHPDAAAHFGAWIAIIEIASRQTPRGTLPGPHTVRSLARISRMPEAVFAAVLPRLVEIGWVSETGKIAQTGKPENRTHTQTEIPVSANALADSPNALGESGRLLKTKVRAPMAPGFDTRKVGYEQMAPGFERFWEAYPRKVGYERAVHAWCFVATCENESALFACLDSYLASDEVSRGVLMAAERWLNECAADKWGSRWPAAGQSCEEERRFAQVRAELKEIGINDYGSAGVIRDKPPKKLARLSEVAGGQGIAASSNGVRAKS